MSHTHAYMMEGLVRKTTAKAAGENLPISPKTAIEICSFIRGKELNHAIATLERVTELRQAVPYKRFTNALGHRTGAMASGRYPVKASTQFLKLLKNAKANASNQGLSGRLVIVHAAANRASEPMRNRAKERVTFKRAHVEIVVAERAEEKKKSPSKKPAAKAQKQES